MLRLLSLAVLLTLSFAGCRSEPRSCVKMKELCGTEADTCRDLREELGTKLGQGAVDTLDGCVLTANTCSAAAGCVTGQAAKATLGAAVEFMSAFADTVNPGKADECVKNAKTPAEAAGCRTGAMGKTAADGLDAFGKGVEQGSR
ncbi:MAG: hypothetical protein U0228_38475 [Myxococcaceae bacterium]